MQLIRDVAAINEKTKGAIIALGNFDGLHVGHRAIITETKNIAARSAKKTALMTFEPHPREVLAKGSAPLRIYNLRTKLEIIESLGIDTVFLLRFTPKFAALSADDFINTILHKNAAASHIVTGENFFFGKGRSGSKELLASTLPTLNIGYTAHPAVTGANGETISSSAIRAHVAKGEMDIASQLLGAPYHISGHVKRGEGRGAKIGFPTANIGLDKLFLPALGVYAVNATIENKTYKGVANLGVKPTFGIHAPLLEVHLFDTNQNLYGKNLTCNLREFIRPELKFDGFEALVAQIQKDVEVAKSL